MALTTGNIQLAILMFLIYVNSKSILYIYIYMCALKNWDCKMRRDIVYEVKYYFNTLYHV